MNLYLIQTTKPQIMYKNIFLFTTVVCISVFAFCQTPKEQSSYKLSVLSYNLCFNALTHNSSNGSAKELGAKCDWDYSKRQHLTYCAENMIDMIEDMPSTYGFDNFDFVGFQEASNFEPFQKAAKTTLAKMKALKTKQVYETSVTLYNENKYSIQYYMDGDLSYGRPFQITVFNEGVIFIALHNDHHLTLSDISERLSGKLLASLTEAQINEIKSYRIIAAGDFNQVALGQRTVSFQPLKYADITTVVSLNNPDKTCCDTKGTLPWSGSMNGDFIFDSLNPAEPRIPSIYDYNALQSDHAPVFARLD